jgi:hypothetical protein
LKGDNLVKRALCPNCNPNDTWNPDFLQSAYIQEKKIHSWKQPAKLKNIKIGLVCKKCGYFQLTPSKDE